MTIKQQGGVFGRNPSYNSVDVATKITHENDPNTAINFPADDTISLETSGASRLRVEPNGNVGIGVSSGITSTLTLPNNAIVAFQDAGGSARNSLQFVSGELKHGAAGAGISFQTFFTGGTERLRIENAPGNVTVKTGNLVIGTSGNGIDFSATAGTGTSELFDDYEEGTFTPEVEGTSTAGTYTYATQTGVYTKVGDLVTVTINLVDITESVAGSGSLRIAGLPFSADGTHVGSLWARSVNFDNSAAYLAPYASGTAIFINEVVDNASGGSLNIADLTSGSARLYITMTYKV